MQRFLLIVLGVGGKSFNLEKESDPSYGTRYVMVLGHSYGMISGTRLDPFFLLLENGLSMTLLFIGMLM